MTSQINPPAPSGPPSGSGKDYALFDRLIKFTETFGNSKYVAKVHRKAAELLDLTADSDDDENTFDPAPSSRTA